ncbi:MAG TPA: response regulator [Dehalococcoidia bacterium]
MKRVLVVEDEPAIRALISASLQGSGCEVASVSDGRAALRALQEARPDLVLLDLGLPGLGGAEVLRRLRADTATAAIPIVLLTGREPPEDAAADAVLLKPFTPATLRRSLAGWLT